MQEGLSIATRHVWAYYLQDDVGPTVCIKLVQAVIVSQMYA